MWHSLFQGITADAIFIVISLGLLELGIFGLGQFIDLKRSKEQVELLEDLVTTMALKEQNGEQQQPSA